MGEEVDVCIVGSGAGGGPLAFELSKAGAKVVVLEKGPWYEQADFVHDEIPVVRRNMWVPFVRDEPHLMQRPGDKRPRPTSDGWISNNVGGGTVHMSGFFYRLHPVDFRMKSTYGAIEGANVADWPIRYEDLAPYYDKTEREVGVSGKAGQYPNEPPRSGDYPMPPLAVNPMARLVEKGAKAVGAHVFDIPRAITSKPWNGRPPCHHCDFCGSYGCESGAKSSSLAALIPRAVETKRCEVRPHSMAFEVVTDDAGKATGVRYYDKDGNEQLQKAKIVCVSATSVESARLLLNSTSNRFPKGLANGSGLVGKNLTFSTLAKAFGEIDIDYLDEELAKRHRVHFLNRAVQDYYQLTGGTAAGKRGDYDKAGTIHFLLPHRNPIFTAERISRRSNPPLWGGALKKALHRYYYEVRELEFETFGEFLSNPGTYVSVDGNVKDKWKIPSATIHLTPHPKDIENSQALLQKGLAILDGAGVTRTYVDTVGGTTYVLQHGTCRFGSDPAESVLDPSCRAHEVPNLYVVDGSFMPTSGGVPCTFTILANSFRVADILIDRMKAGEAT